MKEYCLKAEISVIVDAESEAKAVERLATHLSEADSETIVVERLDVVDCWEPVR